MENKRKAIEFEDPFQGHLVLYCKGHYKIETGKFFEGLKMIWAIRCGYDYELTSEETLAYIANDLYEIIKKVMPEKIDYIMNELHRNTVHKGYNDFQADMSPIEAIIWEYRRHIQLMHVKEQDKETGRMRVIVKLPKPGKRVFNRILSGNGRYDDYKLITKSK